MNLLKLRDILVSTGINFSHYFVMKEDFPYGWWAEDGEGDTIRADNKTTQQAIAGTIHYYTKTEYDKNVQRIQQALNSAQISWKLLSIQPGEIHEDVTHYEWGFTVGGF